MHVHHRCNSVKSEAVHLVLVRVPGKVRKQVADRLPLGVIVEDTIPEIMLPFLTCVEINIVSSIPFVDAIFLVL